MWPWHQATRWSDVHDFSSFVSFLHDGGATTSAVLAAAVTALSYVIKEIWTGFAERRQISKRLCELQIALLAEIDRSIENLRSAYGADREGSCQEGKIMDKFDAAERDNIDFNPYSTVVVEDFVFESIKEEFTSLPGAYVVDLVGYYQCGQLITQCVLDFRSDDFKALAINRKRAMTKLIYQLARNRYQIAMALAGQMRHELWRSERRKLNRSSALSVAATALLGAGGWAGLRYISQ